MRSIYANNKNRLCARHQQRPLTAHKVKVTHRTLRAIL